MERHTVKLVHTFKLPDPHNMQPSFVDTFYHLIGAALCDVIQGGGFWFMTEPSDYVRCLSHWLEEMEPNWERHVREGLATLASQITFSVIKRHEDELDYILSDDYSVRTTDYCLCGDYIKIRVFARYPFLRERE